MAKPELTDIVDKLETKFRKSGLMCKSDCTGNAIGKRYARTDEMGIPFGVTVDYQTVSDKTVTLRDILSTRQLRVPIDKL